MTQSLSVTLPVLSTLNEKDCKPFWNKQCEAIQSALWLPQKTGSKGPGLGLSNGLLNYQVDESRSWMTRITPLNHSTPQSLSVLLPRSAIATTESVLLKGAKVIASKKIRFYPENESAYREALTLYRRSYNLAVEYLNSGKDLVDGKKIDIRPGIRAITKQEQEEKGAIYHNELPNEAVREAKDKLFAVIKNNKKLAQQGAKSGYSSLGFKSRKSAVQTFNFPKFPKGKNIAARALGEVTLTEVLPEECFMRACKVTCDKGRWFLQVQQHIELKTEIQGMVKCVGIDPGVRTFATCFSEGDALIVGDNFAKEKLFPLMKRVDKLISQKQKVLNTQKGNKFIDMPQWARDRIVHFDREINRLKCKKDDLILDLHNRLAHELVSRYDVIFLPSFETKGMVKRKDKKIRTIRRNTCRQMLDLNHYGFKLRLKWYAKKYGKQVVDCNESYTSKTRSWDGSIDEKLGSSKIIKGDGFTVDRDINGARNILLKNLTR